LLSLSTFCELILLSISLNIIIIILFWQSPLCFDFFYTKKSSACFLASPFHKKSRSARLFGCKRPLDDSLVLTTFCEFFVLSYPLVPNYFFPGKVRFASTFFIQKSHPPATLSLLFILFYIGSVTATK